MDKISGFSKNFVNFFEFLDFFINKNCWALKVMLKKCQKCPNLITFEGLRAKKQLNFKAIFEVDFS